MNSDRFVERFRAQCHLLARAGERGSALALAASLFFGAASCGSSTDRTDGTDSDDGDTSSSGSFGGGTTLEELCDRICACEGCSDTERTECIDELEDDERRAEVEGCDTEFDDLVTCADAELACVGDDVELDGCTPQQDALTSCLDGG